MIYCYGNTKEFFEMEFPMGKAPKTITRKGQLFKRNFQAEMASVPATKGWPMECIASGVHASQADELRTVFKEKGLDVRVTNDGNPIYKNLRHRRAALKARGFVDRSGFM